MSRFSKSQYLPPVFLALGMLGRWARWGLYQLATDDKGLLTAHPLSLLLSGLCLFTAVLAAAVTWKSKAGVTQGIFPAIGSAFLGLSMICQSFFLEAAADLHLYTVIRIFSFPAALGAFGLALCHLQKKKPHWGLYALLCVFFSLLQVLCYQLWSDQPQLQDYGFSVSAILCAILFCYSQAAQVLGMKHSRLHGAFALFGIFCCCTALACSELSILCAGTALFFYTQFHVQKEV